MRYTCLISVVILTAGNPICWAGGLQSTLTMAAEGWRVVDASPVADEEKPAEQPPGAGEDTPGPGDQPAPEESEQEAPPEPPPPPLPAPEAPPAQPEVEQPAPQQPEAEKPEAQQPKTQTPETEKPEDQGPGAESGPPKPPLGSLERPGEGPPPPPGGQKPGELAPLEEPLPPPEPGKVSNGGFESGLAAWQGYPLDGDNLRVDSAAANSGKCSLRLLARRSSINPWVSQDVKLLGVPSGVSVTLRARATLGTPSRLIVRLELLDQAGLSLRRAYMQRTITDHKKWQEVKGELIAPAEAAALRLTLRLVGTGGLWVDDVATTVEARPLMVLPRRVATVENAPSTAVLTLLAAPEAQITARLGKDQAVSLTRDGAKLSIELPALKPGCLLLELKAGDAADSVEVWTTPAERRPKLLTEQGWWELGGRRVVLNTMLHARLPETPTLIEHGFNGVQIMAPSNRDTAVRFLRGLPKETPGLVMPAPFSVAEPDRDAVVKGFLEALGEIGRDRRVVAWIIADEPELRLDSYEPELYVRAKKITGLQPMLAVVSKTDELDFWRYFADGVIVNFASSGADPRAIHRILGEVAANLEPWQPVGAVLPAGWDSATPTPDPTRLRLSAFAALGAGARFLGWYCLHTTGWDLQGTTLWPELRRINEDLGKLTDLVAGETCAADVHFDAEGLLTAAWHRKDTRVVLLVNPDSTEHPAKVIVEGAVTGVKVVLGEVKPSLASPSVDVTIPPSSAIIVALTLGGGAPEAVAQPTAGGAAEGRAEEATPDQATAGEKAQNGSSAQDQPTGEPAENPAENPGGVERNQSPASPPDQSADEPAAE